MERRGRFSEARKRALRCLWSLPGLLLLSAGVPAAGSVTTVSASEFAAALEARQGKVVLVNFWATWCRPCLEEIPDLMALEAELAQDGFDPVEILPGLTQNRQRRLIIFLFHRRFHLGLIVLPLGGKPFQPPGPHGLQIGCSDQNGRQ